MIFFHNNEIDSAEKLQLTVSTENKYLPRENILDPLWSKPWLTEHGTLHNIVFDFHDTVHITSAAILLKADAIINNVYLTGSNNGTTFSLIENLYGQANTFGTGFATFATQSYRFLRIDIECAPVEVAIYRVHLGSYFKPINSQQLNYSLEFRDLSRQSKNQLGDRFTFNLPGVFIAKFSTSYIDNSQREEWLDFTRNYGLKKHIFLAMDEDLHPYTQTLYGKFNKIGKQRLIASGSNMHWKNEGWEFTGVREVE